MANLFSRMSPWRTALGTLELSAHGHHGGSKRSAAIGSILLVMAIKSKVSYTQNRNLWGNIEFKTDNGGMTYYSSYNHGYQNPLDYFLLDVLGYWMSN